MTHEPGPDDAIEVPASIELFGFDPVPATARLRPRERAWRVGGSVRTALLFLLVAPAAAVVPPHAPWALGALGLGAFLSYRRWNHRVTLAGLEGACPRCGARLGTRAAQLKMPHPVPCEGCHHEARLVVAPEVLSGITRRGD